MVSRFDSKMAITIKRLSISDVTTLSVLACKRPVMEFRMEVDVLRHIAGFVTNAA